MYVPSTFTAFNAHKTYSGMALFLVLSELLDVDSQVILSGDLLSGSTRACIKDVQLKVWKPYLPHTESIMDALQANCRTGVPTLIAICGRFSYKGASCHASQCVHARPPMQRRQAYARPCICSAISTHTQHTATPAIADIHAARSQSTMTRTS